MPTKFVNPCEKGCTCGRHAKNRHGHQGGPDPKNVHWGPIPPVNDRMRLRYTVAAIKREEILRLARVHREIDRIHNRRMREVTPDGPS